MGDIIVKRISLIFVLLSIMILAGCSTKSSESIKENGSNDSASSDQTAADDSQESGEVTTSENLFDLNDIEEGYWIGQSGAEIQDEDMIISNQIDYNPKFSYFMNKTAYVTYMSDDEILNTVLHDDPPPVTVKDNKEADSIRISFDKKKLDEFELVENE